MMKQAEHDPRNITESHNESAIQMEVYQHQQQSKRKTQTGPYSNAERQRRYREKRKADKINACTTFSQSSNVQPQQEQPQHDVQINKHQPQSNAERQRKYRKLLREQQQQKQQMKHINAITVLSNTPHTSSIHQLQNVDQAEHARKRYLNKQRQSRFRARQRFESPSTSSHQPQAERILYHTEDPELKEKYQRAIAPDSSECCRKSKRKEKIDSVKQKDAEIKRNIPRLPPTIQVKKFASINIDVSPKVERKTQKRPASPKIKISGFIQKPIAIAPGAMPTPPMKKIRMPAGPLLNPVRLTMDRKISNTYSRLPNKPRQTFPGSVSDNLLNGLQNPFSINMPNFIGDNINLSLETLTQVLDTAAFNNNAASNTVDNNVVCTPDFPLEPLCEVTEDNDDDVECITPGPVAAPKVTKLPPLVPRALPDLSSDNIIQMTENEVTVNTLTGGLKFRVDPQTLSSEKMYRLPDGRIFAINPNPNMPGSYSATIVSVSNSTGKASAKGGETFAAKLSAVTPSPTPSGSNSKIRNSLPRDKKGNVSDPLLCNEELTTGEKDANNTSDSLNDSVQEPGSSTHLNDKTFDKKDEEKVNGEKAHTDNQKDNKPNGEMEGDTPNDKLEVIRENGNSENDIKDSELIEKPDVDLHVEKDGEIKKERDETTSDTEDNFKSNENKSDEKTDKFNGDVRDGMVVDRDDISESKVKADEGSKQTEDSEMSKETIKSLLKDNEDTLGSMDVSNASSLDVLDQLGDKQ